jgi:hypothetical protein
LGSSFLRSSFLGRSLFLNPHGEGLEFLKTSMPSHGAEIDEDADSVEAAEFIEGALSVIVAVHDDAYNTSLTQDPYTQDNPESEEEKKAKKPAHPLMIALFGKRIPGGKIKGAP